jgi:hypothetical protein
MHIGMLPTIMRRLINSYKEVLTSGEHVPNSWYRYTIRFHIYYMLRPDVAILEYST